MDFINYFKNSLIDGERFTTRYSDISEEAFPLSLSSIVEGRLPEETDADLPASGDRGTEVLIIPVLLRKESGETVAPLWIPAELSSTGTLTPHPRDIPWMSRYYLSPSRTGEAAIGNIEDYEQFFTERSFEFRNWEEYVAFASDLFSYVTGAGLQKFSHDYYSRVEGGALVVKPEASDHIVPLLETLDDLADKKENELPALFRKFTSFMEEGKEEEQLQSSPPASHYRQVGHLPGSGPLSDSQRQSLEYFFEGENGRMLALNGPPGTGKSMLLTSIVASLFVESAVEEKEAPPLLTATAHDQFTADDLAEDYIIEGDDLIEQRWLPETESYSLYISADPLSDITVSHYSDAPSPFKKRMTSREYRKKAEEEFLEKAGHYFKSRPGTIQDAVRSLHEELTSLVSHIHEGDRLVAENREEDMQQWLKEQNADSSTKEELSDLLDTRYRTKAFSLAARYWEGRWMMEHSPEEDATFAGILPSIRKITPLLVVPVYELPVFFKEDSSGRPLYEEIDWLLIEEASQMLPEVAAPAVAYTKNILAVGDVYQIKPEWNITKTFDVANIIINSGWTEGEEGAEPELVHSGYAASSGSMLRVTQQMSDVKIHPEVSGLFLTEHRRSVPEVINFNNDLVYSNWLQPVRPSIENYPLPHLGIRDVKGEVTRYRNDLANEEEAEQIVDWIQENRETLQSYYEDEEPASLIAVVTPFPAQKELVENRLEEAQLTGITTGTIHMMQGASNPIVLFSSVYREDAAEELNFDSDSSLLNVAVSRAKDAFLVFGDKEIFRENTSSPSSLLRNYLEEF